MRSARLLLLPFSFIYGAAIFLRNRLYDSGILKSRRGSIPTLVIGNLSVGGTGKTPHVIYLATLFSTDYRIAILSRGYGRITKGFLLLKHSTTAADAGDEPLQISQRFPNVPVAVCEDRLKGIDTLKQLYPALQLIILDDAFQHRRLRGDINILLTTYKLPWWKDWLMPAGTLRDSSREISRADLFIITKTGNVPEGKLEMMKKEAGVDDIRKVYFTKMLYEEPKQCSGPAADIYSMKHIVSFCGIANPHYFEEEVRSTFPVGFFKSFPDHHIFSQHDLETIRKECGIFEGSSFAWLTTEKDAMRLKHLLLPPDIPVFYLPQMVAFTGNDDFDQTIKQLVTQRIDSR